MNRKYQYLGFTCIIGLTLGCGAPPISLATLPAVNIPVIDGADTSGATSSNSKLLVVPGKNSNVPAQMQNLFTDEIRNMVIDSGSEVIDRSMAARFSQEIQLKENLSENYKPYEGPVEAKFVIIPTVTGFSYTSEYQKAYSTTDKKGKTYHYDAKCNYKGIAQGNVQIRDMPSMQQVVSVNVNGDKNFSQSNPSNRNCNDKNAIASAVKGAIGDLLDKGDNEYVTLSKYVGSQGLVTGAKSYKGELYFETSLGRFHGAKPKAPVAIYQKIDGELVLIADGKLMDERNILTKKSYIEVDKDVAISVKKGMIVMLSGKCANFLCSISNTLDNVTN